MPACVRIVVGKKGKVIHTHLESLYHPNYETQEFYKEFLEEGPLDFIDGHIEDSEVMVFFETSTYQCNHPLDPIEWDIELNIQDLVIIQNNYKEHWHKQLTLEYLCASNCKEEQNLLDTLIEKWELAYDEDFQPLENVAVY